MAAISSDFSSANGDAFDPHARPQRKSSRTDQPLPEIFQSVDVHMPFCRILGRSVRCRQGGGGSSHSDDGGTRRQASLQHWCGERRSFVTCTTRPSIFSCRRLRKWIVLMLGRPFVSRATGSTGLAPCRCVVHSSGRRAACPECVFSKWPVPVTRVMMRSPHSH